MKIPKKWQIPLKRRNWEFLQIAGHAAPPRRFGRATIFLVLISLPYHGTFSVNFSSYLENVLIDHFFLHSVFHSWQKACSNSFFFQVKQKITRMPLRESHRIQTRSTTNRWGFIHFWLGTSSFFPQFLLWEIAQLFWPFLINETFMIPPVRLFVGRWLV